MNTITRAGSAALAAAVLLITPTSSATPSDSTNSGPQGHAAFVAECLRPLEGGQRSPDVYQGWIDGCRARGGE